MEHRIAIVGLGYVGLPLAIAFSKKYAVTGYDLHAPRIDALLGGHDRTNEVSDEELRAALASGLALHADESCLAGANTYIVTVPTPVDKDKKPDLSHLLQATSAIGRHLKTGDLVIYESTVYPGCTEEDCVPVLEQVSGMRYNRDFYCGYSPERINPGDKKNSITRIKKVTSGSTPAIARTVDHLYASVITAGTHLAPSIKVAEAAKAIENAQRDVNISFVNELALIFDKMGIDTQDVLDAAATKWNFLPYKPGLVGGHCIGVDPYYLSYKAESLGYRPQVILSGRQVNDCMSEFIVLKVMKLMREKGIAIPGCRALILGVTFKENCRDVRNSRVADIYQELIANGLFPEVYDPNADPADVFDEYGIELAPAINGAYQVIILAVAHDAFSRLDIRSIASAGAVIFDTKGVLDRSLVTARL